MRLGFVSAALLLASCTLISVVLAADVATPAADEASWVLDCDNNLVVNPPADKNIKFGDGGKLSFNPTSGDIASDQMARFEKRLAGLETDKLGLKAENMQLKQVVQMLNVTITGLHAEFADMKGSVVAQNDTADERFAGLENDNLGLKAENLQLKQEVQVLNKSVIQLHAEVADIKDSGGKQEESADEDTGLVTSSGAFCWVWGATLDGITGKPGACEFPTEWKTNVDLAGWMLPLMKWVTKIYGNLIIDGGSSGLYFTTFSDVLPNLEEVTGDVTIRECNGLVTNVVGFDKLVKIGGRLSISGNPNLEMLDNRLFPNLQSSGREHGHWGDKCQDQWEGMTGIFITENPKLISLTKVLPSLVYCGHFSIKGNTALKSVTDLGSFSVQGDLVLRNSLVSDVSAFLGITCCSCTLAWSDNDMLTDRAAVCNAFATIKGAKRGGNSRGNDGYHHNNYKPGCESKASGWMGYGEPCFSKKHPDSRVDRMSSWAAGCDCNTYPPSGSYCWGGN